MKRPARPRRRGSTGAVRPRTSRASQRQRLIDACISALHVHGPSNTTVEKVVAIARMSPGIVRFYFDSKAAMLVASLEFLAAEFEQRLLLPVGALRATPVRALEELVDLYLAPELASARKVSVWYSFWGEASSRQEYYDICGMKDDSFAALVRDLVGRLIAATGARHLDAEAVALGLIGALEMLWQEFAFQTESTIDREAARRRAMAYLASVFPGTFSAPGSGVASVGPTTLPRAAYISEAMLAAERRELFGAAWQFVGLASELERPGDFLATELPAGRALALKDASGAVRAFRNDCGRLPHALVAARQGSFAGAITCPLHGLSYRYDGAASGATPGSGLEPLAVAERGNCLYIRPVSAGAGVIGGQSEPPPDVNATAFESAACPCERAVAADWKVLIELWLAEPPPAGLTALRPDMRTGWTRARLAALGETRDPPAAARLFLAPNQFLESGADSLRVVQVVPDAPGRCRVRHFEYTPVGGERAASARAYLERRLARRRLAADCELAESIQRGLATQGAAAPLPGGPAALSEFRQALARLLPSALV